MHLIQEKLVVALPVAVVELRDMHLQHRVLDLPDADSTTVV